MSERAPGQAEAEREALDHALAVFASYREGDLTIDDQHTRIRFVADPGTGRLIASVPAATFFSGHLVLHVPEETDDALALLLSAEEIEESHATDRWLAFHLSSSGYSESSDADAGEGGREMPEHTRWAAFWVDSAKHGPWVFDGDPFMAPNPASAQEPAVCKRVNASPDALKRAVEAATGARGVEGPVCVGVDPRGLYVRLAHGVVRVPFPDRGEGEGASIETLEGLVDRLLGEG
jgi:hypothetical protein